ncbi:Ubiquitin-like protein ATG12 [Gossypium arboreum]|uniref:Ubiquitin-like protein ATG12 n=1 Tax=Gossypium arboreum TaxID=29729 RepID=A0A0B0NDS5_GOSAR|nr:Ubiquitin-like protein ATG12 [Gossypium arboreum]
MKRCRFRERGEKLRALASVGLAPVIGLTHPRAVLRTTAQVARVRKTLPFLRQSSGNPRESRLITDVCALMEPTPDFGVSCASMVAQRIMVESRSHGVLGGDD